MIGQAQSSVTTRAPGAATLAMNGRKLAAEASPDAAGMAVGRQLVGAAAAPAGSLPRKGMTVSSTSTRSASGLRSGSTMARRSLCSSSHAVLVLPLAIVSRGVM